MEDERIKQLEDWMRDRDIRSLVHVSLQAYDEDTPLLLLKNQPEKFDLIYAAVEAMVEDVPESDLTRWD